MTSQTACPSRRLLIIPVVGPCSTLAGARRRRGTFALEQTEHSPNPAGYLQQRRPRLSTLPTLLVWNGCGSPSRPMETAPLIEFQQRGPTDADDGPGRGDSLLLLARCSRLRVVLVPAAFAQEQQRRRDCWISIVRAVSWSSPRLPLYGEDCLLCVIGRRASAARRQRSQRGLKPRRERERVFRSREPPSGRAVGFSSSPARSTSYRGFPVHGAM